MDTNQKLREALQAYMDAGFGSSTDHHKQGLAYDLAIQALAMPTAAPVGELPEPSAHMYPSDLKKFESLEMTGTAFSVAVGCPDERSVPLYTLSNLIAYAQSHARAALAGDADGRRLDWVRDNLFVNRWNGVVGPGCSVQWQVVPDYRFKARNLTESSGIAAGDFRRAIDAAMAASGRQE